MTALAPTSERPAVSVIVPARNEEASLGACLQSLVSQTGLDFEIIVVDDGSTDRTRQIAQSFAGVQLISAPPLPEGWTGKNNAVAAGAQQARGEWLLFTDADTVHKQASIARALREALERGVALLSYSPEQEVHGFWENAIMPVIFGELAATYPPSEVSDPTSPAAAANGQFILISREAYDAVGGHAALGASLLEDVELARRVKASGRKLFFRYGGDIVCTRMYRSFAQLREGWKKNLALLFDSPMRLAAMRLTEFALIVGTAAATLAAVSRGRIALGLILAAAFSVVTWRFVRRIRRAHFSAAANALALFGLPLFAYLLLRSGICYRRGLIGWKGRVYPAAASATGGTSPAGERSAA